MDRHSMCWEQTQKQSEALLSWSLRVGSLQMANLAVRHVDGELAEATRNAYEQAGCQQASSKLQATFLRFCAEA